MTPKEKINYLITNYLNGKYDTTDFCDLFVVYYRDMIDDLILSDIEEIWLDKLSDLCYRFSDSPEDLAIPNVYVDEVKIREYLTTIPKSLI